MKNPVVFLAVALLLRCWLPSCAQPKPVPPLSITSPGFGDGGLLAEKYTAPTPFDFQNSPPLQWRNAPEATASFLLLVHDVDAAVEHGTGDVTHWLIYNIPGTSRELGEGIAAGAQRGDGSVQAPNVLNKPGYLGPGARGAYHHYLFELYALDCRLNLPVDAGRAQIFSAMQGHVLGKAVLVGRYMRQDSTPLH